MMNSIPTTIGAWQFKKLLGKGSFGEVSLWENKETFEKVAIKKCILIKENHTPESIFKLKERWRNEVDMITNKIKNENIVKTVQIQPSEFIEELNKNNTSGLPLLVMEYCNGGDLRTQLNQKSNYCGLQESDIRDVIKSLRESINCLHNLGITHRDIKPENIVIQLQNDKKTYKLTDLGYAKDIKETVAGSHVGTVGYFAPELILEQEYSCTVDYWSMGVIIFEIICGCRPFVPHMRIANLMRLMNEKQPNDIACTENMKGKIIYHSELFSENRITGVLKSNLEDWLKLALNLNKRNRGSKSTDSNGKPVRVIFTEIDRILSLKILTVFSMITYEFLSYEVTEEMTLNELITLIEHDTKTDKKNLYIFLPVEQTVEINQSTKPIDLILDNCGNNEPMIFITDVTMLNFEKIQNIRQISDVIKENMNCDVMDFNIKSYHILEFCRHALYLIENEDCLHKTFLKGLKDYAMYLNDLIVKYEVTVEQMRKKSEQMLGTIKFQNFIFDLHKGKLERNNMTNKYADKINKWETVNNYNNKIIQQIIDISTKISRRYTSILRRSNEIVDMDLVNKIEQQYFQVDNVTLLYEKLKENRDENIFRKCHKKISILIKNCLQQRENLLKKPELRSLQEKLSFINEEFLRIQEISRKHVNELSKYEARINECHSKQFDELWEIIESHTIIHFKDEIEKGKTGNFNLSNLTVFNSIANESETSFDRLRSSLDNFLLHENEELRILLQENIELTMEASTLVSETRKLISNNK